MADRVLKHQYSESREVFRGGLWKTETTTHEVTHNQDGSRTTVSRTSLSQSPSCPMCGSSGCNCLSS